ncbi:ankyrin repeat domain-containing protein [Neolewinella sp.]|uniref:ankyrin repeat domain-containing protein n=1 Tax=Neolewinella sp. TaxID=2993543 RepID=UPI003B516711
MNSSERLFGAIRSGDVDGLRGLLQAEPQLVHARDLRGSTPLVLAAYLDQLECTRLLIAAGARPNVKDAAGSTPLMGASFRGHRAIVSYLIEQGAGVDVPGPDGMTALHFAEMGGNGGVKELLLAAGARPVD